MTVQALLIGLDGGTFGVLDPLMDRGVMPNLRDLCERGCRSDLRTVMPPLTPPGWTSMVTGKRPGDHGVFDFFQKESADNELFRLATSEDIRAATVWSLASDHGRKVISLNFPLMFPPPPVNGCVVPGGWMPWRQLRLGCHPAGLFDRLKTLPSFNPRELSLDMELEAKAIEGCAEEEYRDWIELHIRREARWFEVLTYLLETEPADLVGVVFDGVDKLQHLCWRFLDPASRPADPSPWEEEIAALCDSYFAHLDGIIGQLVALAGPQAVTVLASDHGFGPSSEVFYLNAWLEQHGYLAWADDEARDAAQAAAAAPRIGFKQMTRHVYELDWDRTVAYAATPSSNGIHIVAREPGGDGPLPEEVRRRISAELASRLAQIPHPANGHPVVAEVWTREEAFAGPFEALAPDVSMILEGGAAISILRSGTLVRRREVPLGSHRWEGMFVACGPSIRSGATFDALAIVDVAPLLLYVLDLPIPEDMTGVVPEAVFDPDRWHASPPVRAPGPQPAPPAPRPWSNGAPPEAASEVAADGEDDALVLSRLRALGYVE
ncbi:MAG: alkaline phosphatase family protein [Acidimicrobiales bacterium]